MASNQRPLKVKLYPRTKGVLLTGSCGHDYKIRLNLGVHARQIVSATADKEIEIILKKYRKNAKKELCKDCISLGLLKDIELSNKIMLESLGLPLLTPITGALGQRAWAEETRNEHLRYLLFGSVSPNLAPSVLEIILSNKEDHKTLPDKLNQQILAFKNISKEINDTGYLGRLYNQELASSSDRMLLRRLLINRALIRNNMRIFEETRHTFWIMYNKRGNNASTTRYVPLSQTEFLAIAYVVNEDLDSVEEYEKAIEVLSKKAYKMDKEILDTLPDDISIIEKAELMKVYYSLLDDNAKDAPF